MNTPAPHLPAPPDMDHHRLIDGKAMAADMTVAIASRTEAFLAKHMRRPTLAVVLIGDDPASTIYVKRKIAAARKAGIASAEHRLSETVAADTLLQLINQLNRDPAIDGILVQLPLPGHIDAVQVLDRIDPAKDVDGFHPVNVGRLSVGSRGLVPCTPLGCMRLLDSVVDNYRGKNAVVIGKSNIVGKPVALLLLERECTVTVTHIHTCGLPDIVQKADIVVVAAGSPGLVRGDWVKPGAVVIDVGINRVVGDHGPMIVGDVVTHEMGHAKAVTPVPGGVGPMTVACLLSNTIEAAEKREAFRIRGE